MRGFNVFVSFVVKKVVTVVKQIHMQRTPIAGFSSMIPKVKRTTKLRMTILTSPFDDSDVDRRTYLTMIKTEVATFFKFGLDRIRATDRDAGSRYG